MHIKDNPKITLFIVKTTSWFYIQIICPISKKILKVITSYFQITFTFYIIIRFHFVSKYESIFSTILLIVSRDSLQAFSFLFFIYALYSSIGFSFGIVLLNCHQMSYSKLLRLSDLLDFSSSSLSKSIDVCSSLILSLRRSISQFCRNSSICDLFISFIFARYFCYKIRIG